MMQSLQRHKSVVMAAALTATFANATTVGL